jgi:hypothetical protein
MVFLSEHVQDAERQLTNTLKDLKSRTDSDYSSVGRRCCISPEVALFNLGPYNAWIMFTSGKAADYNNNYLIPARRFIPGCQPFSFRNSPAFTGAEVVRGANVH